MIIKHTFTQEKNDRLNLPFISFEIIVQNVREFFYLVLSFLLFL